MIAHIKTGDDNWIKVLLLPILIMLYAKELNNKNLKENEKDKN
jgi:hypothetical protein